MHNNFNNTYKTKCSVVYCVINKKMNNLVPHNQDCAVIIAKNVLFDQT